MNIKAFWEVGLFCMTWLPGYSGYSSVKVHVQNQQNQGFIEKMVLPDDFRESKKILRKILPF